MRTRCLISLSVFAYTGRNVRDYIGQFDIRNIAMPVSLSKAGDHCVRGSGKIRKFTRAEDPRPRDRHSYRLIDKNANARLKNYATESSLKYFVTLLRNGFIWPALGSKVPKIAIVKTSKNIQF